MVCNLIDLYKLCTNYLTIRDAGKHCLQSLVWLRLSCSIFTEELQLFVVVFIYGHVIYLNDISRVVGHFHYSL